MSYKASQSDRPPRFRVQEAILILREGKKNPLWREAAWHLMEHAHKDTQLLLEAQRELLERDREPILPWYRRWLLPMGIVALSLVFLLLVYGLLQVKGGWCIGA